MKYIEYLYFKYYRFQEKVGNEDIAPFTSMLIIDFTFWIYYFGLASVLSLFFPMDILSENHFFAILTIIIFASSTLLLYFKLVHRGRYKEVLLRNQEYRGRKRLGAILFPLLAFIIFNLGWILKMLQNQSRLPF